MIVRHVAAYVSDLLSPTFLARKPEPLMSMIHSTGLSPTTQDGMRIRIRLRLTFLSPVSSVKVLPLLQSRFRWPRCHTPEQPP